jgi:hypothetical protein
MKKFTFLSVVLVSALLSVSSFAQTNAPAPTLADQAKTAAAGMVSTVASNAAPTINSVMIEILSGTKDAAKEIYGASKEAIHKSIDFVGEQAPDVIKQFLLWRFFRAGTWCAIWLAVASVLFLLSFKLMKFQKKVAADGRKNSDDHAVSCVFKWILMLVACGFIIGGVGSNSFEMVKIKVAPKVYIIEYVVGLIQGQTPANMGR